jgi:uncharacterized membrane protein
MLEKLRKPALFVAVLSAVKLITDAFGYQVFTDEQINDISNGLASIFTVVGILINRDVPQ